MAKHHRRKFITTSLTAAATYTAACSLGKTFAWQDDTELPASSLITKQTDKAIKKGLDFLAASQQNDGSMGSSGYSRNIGICSLAGLAFMSSGSTPGRGPYGLHVKRCLKYALNQAQDDGYLKADDTTHGPMYGHGFAMLFIAECYGMSQRKDLRKKLVQSVKLLVAIQNDSGGWRYDPNSTDADLSVTVCQIMALRAARNAGIHVPNETVNRCISYIKQLQNSDGGFSYMNEGGVSDFPRSAAGVVALYSSGIYEGEEISKGINYISSFQPNNTTDVHPQYFFYGHYYAMQAMWHAGGNHWKKWYPAVRDLLLARQQADGSWVHPKNLISKEYATAMACITLQMPNNYLPIFQR